MYWGAKGGPRFIRPVRWLVALLGEEVVPFEIAGVRSGAVSSGHRQLGAAQVPVTIENFDRQLDENGVIVSAAARSPLMANGLARSQRNLEKAINPSIRLR